MRKKTTRKEKQNKNLLVEEKVLIYIILKLLLFVKVCPTFKFENVQSRTKIMRIFLFKWHFLI